MLASRTIENTLCPLLYRLTLSVTTQRRSRLDVEARAVACWPGETITLPVGTWLLALPDTANIGPQSSPLSVG